MYFCHGFDLLFVGFFGGYRGVPTTEIRLHFGFLHFHRCLLPLTL
jgi:hypothetical protein